MKKTLGKEGSTAQQITAQQITGRVRKAGGHYGYTH